MQLTKRKLVTIIAESALEAAIIKDIKRLGARGYTQVDSRGAGDRGVRKGDWDQDRNVLIQTICSEDRAHTIMSFIFEQYCDDYAIITYATDIEVLRHGKF